MTGNVRYPAERPGLASEPNGGGREATSRYRKESASSPATRMAVTTTGLTKRYGDACVVNSVNLAVPEHAVYGFLGPNGAGKSTTMKMLLGLVHPTEGSATILGTPLTPENRLEVLRHVGSLIESPSCYPHLTARENLEIVRQLRGLPKSEIDEVLRIVRLDDPSVRRKRVGNFSLGMKQRLGIAAALMGRPPLLLLDEPTNGLDPAGIHEIRALVKELPRMFDMTVVERVDALVVVDAPLPQLPGHAQGTPGVEQDGTGRRDRPRRVVGLCRGEAHEGADEVGKADAEPVGDLLGPGFVPRGETDEEPVGIPFHVAHAPSFSTAAVADGS